MDENNALPLVSNDVMKQTQNWYAPVIHSLYNNMQQQSSNTSLETDADLFALMCHDSPHLASRFFKSGEITEPKSSNGYIPLEKAYYALCERAMNKPSNETLYYTYSNINNCGIKQRKHALL